MLCVLRSPNLRPILNHLPCISSILSRELKSSHRNDCLEKPETSSTPSDGELTAHTSSQNSVSKKNSRTSINVRRQRAGTDKPVFQGLEDYLAKAQSWKAQLPHEDDPSVYLRPAPDPRNRGTDDDKPPTGFLSATWLTKVTKKIDLSPEGMAEYFHHRGYQVDLEKQKFNPSRHAILGPDLATAHFIVYRGGRIKFVGHSEWWSDEKTLPSTYEEGFIIEKIDASSTGLLGEGITNMSNLYNLTDLNLSNNHGLDVFAFDKLYRQFRFSSCLKHLNLTGCSRFCENSLTAIHRLPSLEEVIITKTQAAEFKFLELILIMLHDLNPRLKVIM